MIKFLIGFTLAYSLAAWAWGALFYFAGEVRGHELYRALILWPISADELIDAAIAKNKKESMK